MLDAEQKAKPRNAGASVRAQLLQRARDEQTDFQLILTRFVLERLLYRLSVSRYRDRFILKGALLLAVLAGDLFRPTRDLDLLGYGDTSPDALAKIFCEICPESVTDDGVTFNAEALRAEQIRDESEYGGVRIRTTATIAGARIRFRWILATATRSLLAALRSSIQFCSKTQHLVCGHIR